MPEFQKAKPAKQQYKNIYLPKNQRAIASLAHIAMVNTVLGGASALTKAKRMDRIFKNVPDCPSVGCSWEDIVGSVYSSSTGKTSEEFGAWECGECGGVHLGMKAALNCCMDYEEESFEDEEEEF